MKINKIFLVAIKFIAKSLWVSFLLLIVLLLAMLTWKLIAQTNSGDVAVWVQAIGSLVALAVAIGVAWWQGRQSRKLFLDQINHAAEEARLQRIASLRATVEVAEIVARRLVKAARNMSNIIIDGGASRHRDAFEAATLWISKLPIYELPGALVAREVQNIGLYANRMHNVLVQICTDGYQSDESCITLWDLSVSAEKTLASLTSFADEYSGGVEVIRAADL